MPIASPSSQFIVDATQQWLERAVIGLNLCPFAKAVHVKRQIRYTPKPTLPRSTRPC